MDQDDSGKQRKVLQTTTMAEILFILIESKVFNCGCRPSESALPKKDNILGQGWVQTQGSIAALGHKQI